MNNYFSVLARNVFHETAPERYINEFKHKETRGDRSWVDRSNVLIAEASRQHGRDTEFWRKVELDSGSVSNVGESSRPRGREEDDA